MQFVIAAVLMLGAAPAASAQSRQEQQMAAELRILQEQQQQLALSMAQLAEAIAALHPRFNESNEALRKSLANLELTIRNMANDVSTLRAQAQDSGTRLGTLRDELEALRATVEALPAEIARLIPPPQPAPADPNAISAAPGATPPQATGQAPAVAVSPPVVGAVTSRTPAPTAGLNPTRMLDQALRDFYDGQYTLAISGFEAIVKDFSRTTAAAEAQYFIGDSYSNDRKWNEAVRAYTLLIDNYPASSRVADAYYKRGVAYESLEQWDAASTSFAAAVKSHPDTDGGRLAAQGLQRVANRLKATAKP